MTKNKENFGKGKTREDSVWNAYNFALLNSQPMRALDQTLGQRAVLCIKTSCLGRRQWRSNNKICRRRLGSRSVAKHIFVLFRDILTYAVKWFWFFSENAFWITFYVLPRFQAVLGIPNALSNSCPFHAVHHRANQPKDERRLVTPGQRRWKEVSWMKYFGKKKTTSKQLFCNLWTICEQPSWKLPFWQISNLDISGYTLFDIFFGSFCISITEKL